MDSLDIKCTFWKGTAPVTACVPLFLRMLGAENKPTLLPQAQKENEGDNESSNRYTVTKVVDDEGYLVVHGVPPL